jgi:MFS family permease
VLDTYRAVFRVPGSAAFCTAGFVMRLPYAIYPVGLVLIVSAQTGRYTFAGALAGIYVAANGVGNPVLARLVDRLGQHRVLLPATAAHVLGLLVLGVLIKTDSPLWTYIPPTMLAGFAFLAVGSLTRTRWSYVLAGRPELSTAYSVESTIDEVVFTLGPLIATVLATQADPVLVLVVGGAFVATGALLLRPQRATEPPAHEAGAPRGASALLARGMVLLTLTAVAMGAIFASAEVTMVAFAGQHGDRVASGILLACFAAGSGVAGFGYGARHWSGTVLVRFRMQALIFGALPLLFLIAPNVPVLAVCAFVVGLGIAPTLITAFGLIEQLVASSALAEGLAWLTTGLSIGYGAGSSLVGPIADAHGARLAFTVTVGAGLAMATLALVLFRRLSPASEPVAVG